jgi:hypothetical protein
MLNFVVNLLENERDPRSGPMNDQDHSLSLSDPDRSLVLSHFLTNFLQNLASCHTAFKRYCQCQSQCEKMGLTEIQTGFRYWQILLRLVLINVSFCWPNKKSSLCICT